MIIKKMLNNLIPNNILCIFGKDRMRFGIVKIENKFSFVSPLTFHYLCNELKTNDMARPIKETPVVTGKDAERFAEKMAHLKPESKEEKEAAKKVYEKFKAIAAFTF